MKKGSTFEYVIIMMDTPVDSHSCLMALSRATCWLLQVGIAVRLLWKYSTVQQPFWSTSSNCTAIPTCTSHRVALEISHSSLSHGNFAVYFLNEQPRFKNDSKTSLLYEIFCHYLHNCIQSVLGSYYSTYIRRCGFTYTDDSIEFNLKD